MGQSWCLRAFLHLVLPGVVLIADLVQADSYCWYYHERYNTIQTTYCTNGCCKDYGKENEICCFSWSVGVILGVCFASLTLFVIVVVMAICCYYSQKRRNRTGVMVTTPSQHTNTVVYTGAAGYAYPHPPSAFYPASQFPNAAPAYGPPPAYPFGQAYPSGTYKPPAHGHTTEASAPVEPAYPPVQASSYGNGSGQS